MGVRVKICGITQVRDALAAVEAGADALGFMFFRGSPRWIPAAAVAEIIRELPPFIAKVGVFVNASEGMVRKSIGQCGLDTLQFHGDEPPDFCRKFGLKAIRAFRIRGEDSLAALPEFRAETWLLDSFVPGQRGGSGATFNWEIARKAVAMHGRVILAGGLTPANISQAVTQVRPYAVDVSSGVESAPGRKDREKLKAFIRRAKEAGQ